MLMELNIEDKTFLFECEVKGAVIEYLLYDSNENWRAVRTQEEVSQTLELLNKRIKYDTSTAYDTLQNKQPEAASWVASDVATGQHTLDSAKERVLKLKYRVKDRPFNFEWCLKRRDSVLTIPIPVNEISSLMERLPVQIEELLEVLRRKEDEIKQYRTEYGSLRRSTLATNAFDVDKFREQYAATGMKVKILQKIIERWRAEHGEIEPTQDTVAQLRNNCSPVNAIKTEGPETSSPTGRKNVRESPRNRKRKITQEKKAQMTRTLQTRRQKLEYESQSQTLSESEPQLQDTKELIAAEETPISSVKIASNANNNENKVGKQDKRQLNTTQKVSITIAANPVPNRVAQMSCETAKEVASKNKKLSPRDAKTPNTRQRRRELEVQQNNSDDVTIIENPNNSVIYSVEEAIESAENSAVASAKIHTTNKNTNTTYLSKAQKCSTPQVVEKVQPSKNELSDYVDSVLNQLEAFDKQLKAEISGAGIEEER